MTARFTVKPVTDLVNSSTKFNVYDNELRAFAQAWVGDVRVRELYPTEGMAQAICDKLNGNTDLDIARQIGIDCFKSGITIERLHAFLEKSVVDENRQAVYQGYFAAQRGEA